jgi:hypothetical protein
MTHERGWLSSRPDDKTLAFSARTVELRVRFFVASGEWKIHCEAGFGEARETLAPGMRVWFNLSVFGRN